MSPSATSSQSVKFSYYFDVNATLLILHQGTPYNTMSLRTPINSDINENYTSSITSFPALASLPKRPTAPSVTEVIEQPNQCRYCQKFYRKSTTNHRAHPNAETLPNSNRPLSQAKDSHRVPIIIPHTKEVPVELLQQTV